MPPAPPVVVVCEERPLDVGGARRWHARTPQGAAIPGRHVVLVACQHGNEPVGALVLERFASVVQRRLRAGVVTGVIANQAARALDVRYTPDGQDMNRLWDRERLAVLEGADPAGLDAEERRVREIAPLVMEGDVVLDLHSTSRPSPAHLLLRDDLEHARLAARLGVSRLVTGVHERAILDGGLCANVGLGRGEPGPRLGFTLEAGQHDNPENLDRAWKVVVRLLVEVGLWDDPDDDPSAVPYEVYDIVERFRQAPAGRPPYRFVGFEGGEPGAGRHGPARRLESFETIEADEVVLRRDAGEVVRAEAPFTMLMPAPTAGPGEDLYYVCQRRHAALGTRPLTHDAAGAEAAAVERVLDLLAGDEAQRGTTRVSTTSRRTLGLCADLVARATRLPEGHPDRRVTIVGRGDWGGDEMEQRAAQPWHTAVDRALASGVPVTRIQLLRGATLGWLDHLAERVVDTGGALRLRLVPAVPHTLSVVLVGDPTRARRTGDYRHVEAGLLVEAATPEPDGDQARARVLRAGVFGSRPALVQAATDVIEALERAHTHALEAGRLGDASALAPFTAPDGALVLDGPDACAAIRDGVGKVVERRWRAALTPVVAEAHLEPGRLGAWLARAMGTTGILDGDVLARWVARRTEDGGWHVDPARLAAPVPTPMRPDPLPPVVLTAAQVDADNIERWTGWVRFLRDTQALPGTRGRDLDVALDADAIQHRVARWMDDARRAAEDAPGQWLVAISGDGLSPMRDHAAEGWNVLWAHRRLLLSPHVRYLRVQHAQGTHFGWMKDFAALVGARDPDGVPVGLAWETEHGGSLHVMLVARRDADADEPQPWSLEGWTVERCTVLVGGGGGGYQVAMFTEPGEDGHLNQELAHFVRTHVERLLRPSSWRMEAAGGLSARMAIETEVRQLLADLAIRLEEEVPALRTLDAQARPAWVAAALGIQDREVAAALAEAAVEGRPAWEAARAIWKATEAWPGRLWDELGRID